MKHTLRAALAVALLVGFYVVAIGIVAGVVLLVVEAAVVGASGAALLKLAVVAGLISWAIVRGLFGRREASAEPAGVLVPREDQPTLWAEVKDLATVVGTREPDEIRLVAEVNAAVSEDTKLLGLVPGTRRLYLGVPLVLGLTRQELRSVLAHELGHYSGRHTALGPVTYRGKEAIARVLGELGPDSLVGRLLGLYGRLYYAVSHTVSRRQELEADEFSARIAGGDAAASSLQKLVPLGAAWDHFVDAYASLGQESGRRPAPLFQGFSSLLDDPETQDQLAHIRDEHAEPASSVYDSHPPISQRVARILALPADGQVDDGTPATRLLDRPDAAWETLEQHLYAGSGLQVAPWDELVAVDTAQRVSAGAAVLGRQAQASGAAPTLRSVVAALGRPGSTGLFDADDAQEDRRVAAQLMAGAAADALVSRGEATFALSWGSGPVLTSRGGEVIDPWAPAREAVDGPVDAFEAWAAAHGLDLDAELPIAEEVAGPQPPDQDAVLGGVSPVSGDSARVLLVTHHGIILRTPGAGERMVSAVFSYFGGSSPRLAKRASRLSPAELTSHRGSTFIGWEEIARVELRPRRLKAMTVSLVLRTGVTRTIKVSRRSGVVGEPWQAMVHYLGDRYVVVED